jgi:hypothetical protein
VFLRLLARLCPVDVDASEDLRRSVAFLGWTVEPRRIVRAGYGAGVVVTVGAVVVAALLPWRFQPAALPGAVAAGLLGIHAVHVAPKLLATDRRTSALGAGPDLIGRAIMRMRIEPSPERAAAFAARTGDSRLAVSLADHVRTARTRPTSGLESFGAEWDAWFPSLDRAANLIEAAGSATPADRETLLDRAMGVVLSGTETQMRDFAVKIQGPASVLYAFGVLLPTALVALLPAARSAGLAVTSLTMVLVYDLLVPAVVAAGSVWLLAQRPVAFPPPRVTTSHPDVPDRTRRAVLAGAATAAVAWAASGQVLPAWAPPVVSLGTGLGLVLWLRYRPMRSVREHTLAVEEGLSDALTHVGRRVAAGAAVETAIRETATDVDGAIAEVLVAGSRRQRRLDGGLRESFLGAHGALAEVPSRRARGSVELLVLAATEGRPAGSAILALADHIDDLERIEAEARGNLDRICATLRSTGVIFGPLVAGVTVGLAGKMAGSSFLDAGAITWLGAAVGWYTLLLAGLLTALATGLRRGFDRALLGYRLGRGLVTSALVYAGSYLLVTGVA